MVEIIISVASKVSEYLVDPVVHQLGYLFNYGTNIKDLSEKVEKLEGAWKRLRHSVDEAKRNGHIIEDDVNKWLADADAFILDVSIFLIDEKAAPKSCCFNSGLCPNLKSRHRLSRAAKKKAGVAVLIHGDALQFETKRVSYRPTLQEMRPAPSEALQSRMRTLNQVMEALRDANIDRIGVWGMGGVGKSTLAKQLAQQAEQDKLFGTVVTASVFQTPDFRRIQGELADMLGLKFDEETEHGRAARLRRSIMEEKSILIILDDLWSELELERIGIPSPADHHHKGCKLLLTSRNRDILSNEMGTQKEFLIEPLQEDESWVLFKNKAGDTIETEPELRPIAMGVAKECAGLPIALVTVATALRSKNLPIWRDALQQLQRPTPTPTNIRGMDAKVYSSLELSYKHLQGDEVKFLFLLCAIISSNSASTDDMLYYCIGLGLLKGTNTFEEAKNRIDTLVDNLKASNLLLESDNDIAFVRMHDVVRNVALMIMSKEHHVFAPQQTTLRKDDWPGIDELRRITWIWLDEFLCHELPEGLVCPKLELFGCYPKRNSSVKVPDNFFEGMKQLKVVDFTNMHLPSLPSSLGCLENLRTLCLDGWKSGDITIIPELKKLEILTIRYSNIEELPKEIAVLTHLRLLDLRGSSSLKLIPPGLISSLGRLENLYMGNSFTQWEMEGKSNTNACLAELNHLTLLTSLDIEIPDVKLLSKDNINVFDNLVRHRILVGEFGRSGEERNKTDRTLKLNKFNTRGLDHDLVDGIIKLLKRSEGLHLCELCGGTVNAVSKLDDGEGFPKLKHLNVESSPEIHYIANSMDLTTPCAAFPVMETLCLDQLINLKQVCHGHDKLPAGSFGCLRKVEVENCMSLVKLFPLSFLQNLEELIVISCEQLEQVIDFGGVHGELLPKLKNLDLRGLPKLRHILCNWGSSSTNHHLSSSCSSSMASDPAAPGINIILFPKLTTMSLLCLPALESFSNTGSGYGYKSPQRLHDADLDTPPHVLFPQTVAFPCLELLEISKLDNVKKIWENQHPDEEDSFSKLKGVRVVSCGEVLNIFPPSILKRLQSLRELEVECCDSLKEVFDVEGIIMDANANGKELGVSTVIQLSELKLESLPKLEKIWNKDPHGIVSFQNIKSICIEGCENLKNIFPACLVRDLVELRKLDVFSSGIEEIISKVDNGGGGGVIFEASPTFVFPKLTILGLRKLPQLRSLYPGPHTSQWPFLEILDVDKCPKLNSFALESSTLPTLEERHVAAIPCLEESRLGHNYSNNTEIWPEQFSVNIICFPRLVLLSLDGYGGGIISAVIPSSLLQGLHNLEMLFVRGISSAKEVFQLEGLPLDDHDEEHHQAKPLRRLREIGLCYLPRLTHLWKQRGNNKPAGLDLQSLEVLTARKCDSLIALLPSSSASSFQNLAILEVSFCGSLTSLISPSVAKTLVKLKTLIIDESLMMEEVVSNDQGGEDLIDENIVFCKLERMVLVGLPNLTSFSSGGCTFSFPSLEFMKVERCPRMKIFSSRGLVTTPKLESVLVEDDERHWQDDLNTTIQSLFIKRHDNVEVESVQLLEASSTL